MYALVNEIDNDLGKGSSKYEGIGPGCRPLGQVSNAHLIINKNGVVHEYFCDK
jgi:hypothetical protein